MKYTIQLAYVGFIEVEVDAPDASEALQKAREKAESLSDEEIVEQINLYRENGLDEIVACEKGD